MHVVVDYSKKAKKHCVGGEHNMRIYYKEGDKIIGKDLFSRGKLRKIREKKIPIIIKSTTKIPLECIKEPEQYELFGRIKWK